ncbi:MAG: hypothetical protein ACLTCI_06050 [[Clostridium] nexile]
MKRFMKNFSAVLRGCLIMSSLCVLVAFYSASAVLGMECDLKKVMNLLRSTKQGRIQLLTKKIGVAFGITCDGSLIKLPFILNIAKTYPLENWGAKCVMIFAGQSV